MKYSSFVCARCNGLLLGGTPKKMIAGKAYHVYCASKILEEKIKEDIKKLSKEKE